MSGTPASPTRGGEPHDRAVASAVRRCVVVYVPLALLWIVGSNALVAWLSGDPMAAFPYVLLEGVVFLAPTTVLLFFLARRALRDLARQRALTEALVEGAPDLIIRLAVSPELRFEYVSPASSSIAGYSPQELYDDPDLILRTVHPDDADRLRRVLAEPSVEQTSIELRFLHKDDGSVVWTQTRVTWLSDEEGHPTTAVAVVRNITDQHEDRRMARLLVTAVEAAGEAVIVTDASGTIEYVNPQFERMSGYTRGEVVGQNPRVLKSGRQNPRFYARLWSTLRSGGTFRGHFVNRAKDGRLYEQQSTITPVAQEAGEPTHFVAVARDVTVEREIHRQIAASEQAAAVAELAAGIAHDLRNLLTVVSANVDLLSGALGHGSRGEEELSDIERAVRSGSELITRLLSVARPTSGQRELTDLVRHLESLKGILTAAVDRSILVRFDLDADTLPVQVDRGRIEQALLNLVRNAAQAMVAAGGELTVLLGPARRLPATAGPDAHARSFVRLAVVDTGVGMDDVALKKVTEPFFTTKETGTGLGVPMVLQAVEEHGGYLEYESELGVGTTVSIYLPVADEVALVEASEEAGPPGPDLPGGTERILIVDDDAGLRRAAERCLSRMGYDITTAGGGLDAIRMIEDGQRWDLVLTDLMMPGLGGADLYRRLEERDIRMPVVFMSGHPPDLIDKVARESVTGFLPKPWTIQTISRTVRDALDAR